MFLGVAILVPIAFYLWISSKKSFDWLRFHSKYTGEPVLYFHFNKPDEKTFSIYIKKLVSLIKTIEEKEQENIESNEVSVTNKIKEFAQLRDKGLISEEEYQISKKKLLNQIDNPEKQIGF